jgi:hypothetical protein
LELVIAGIPGEASGRNTYLRMNTELRKIILEEHDEDEDEFIPTIYDIYHESPIPRATIPAGLEPWSS